MDRARDGGGEVRRRELAAFLRSRRERITPREIGLPSTGRRRTPGLRREEVAELAGVGVTWYTWLEQGRAVTPSAQVLAALGAALRLGADERAHLAALARPPRRAARPPSSSSSAPDVLDPALRAVLARLDPWPGVVHNARTDILAHNRGYDWLLGVDALPVGERNSLRLVATHPRWRERMRDWPQRLPAAVAEFRAQTAEHLDEPGWSELVGLLRRESPTFDELWRRHDVHPPRGTTKRFAHPVAGTLTFDFTVLWCGPRSDVRVTTYTPADDRTAAAVDTHVRTATA